jgi:hypothetical protein
MATDDDTGAAGAANSDDQIAAATSVYEGRLLLESARMAIETLAGRDKPATVEELGIIEKFLRQAGDAFEEAQRALNRLFGIEVGNA